MYLEKARARETDLYRVGCGRMVPCTLGEVAQLEQQIGHALPAAYREFLLWMGRSGGGFLTGSDCFYRSLADIQEGAKELLQEDHFSGTLPDNAFVFFMHQGYQFNFFLLNEGDDPPVYLYFEEIPTSTSFALICPCFSDFILTEIDGYVKLKESMKARRDVHPRKT
ncbi:MAG: SMI1/KNR4 family protein [Ktedonobacteraceae bacterium]